MTIQQLTFEPTFAGWQRAARHALQHALSPEDVVWQPQGADQPGLGLFQESSGEQGTNAPTEHRVPRTFIALAQNIVCHSSDLRWSLLYRVLWRLTHGEPKLLEVAMDQDVHLVNEMNSAIRRDVHKMRAFVRFREVPVETGTWYVAWFEPEHYIVELNAPFFVDRFASMRWSILTPDRCVHWDTHELRFIDGVSKSAAPTGDEVESLWLTYYSHIFNPARLKLQKMQADMPKRYWSNLPETAALPSLIQDAPRRVEQMIAASEQRAVRPSDFSTPPVPSTTDLAQLHAAAKTCQACPLWKNASCTVFGEGPANARIVLVGEQPGDQEDRAGKPFVGPAGQLLNRALADAGIDRSSLYVTNAVKHFKWVPRGKRRMHDTPNAKEILVCRPWLEAELRSIQPELTACLGGTAAHSLFGAPVKVLQERGRLQPSPYGGEALVTVHPSSLLRMPDKGAQEKGYAQFVADLKLLQRHGCDVKN